VCEWYLALSAQKETSESNQFHSTNLQICSITKRFAQFHRLFSFNLAITGWHTEHSKHNSTHLDFAKATDNNT